MSRRIGEESRSTSQLEEATVEQTYPPDIEEAMRDFFDCLPEHQRRHYAAVEALKLGHGGIRYLASVLYCDEKTIRRGLSELECPDPLPPGRCRKKGVGGET
jgi:hypothetical protein